MDPIQTPHEVQEQTPTNSQPTPKNKKRIYIVVILFALIILIIGVIASVYYFRQINVKLGQTAKISVKDYITPSLTPDSSIYSNKELGFEFTYPSYLASLIQDKNPTASGFLVSSVINDGSNPYLGKDCPGTCGVFSRDSDLYRKQFTLLTEAGNNESCILDENYIQDFKKDFMLFYSGVPGKQNISGIKLGNNLCGIQYIATDGYDVALDNYHYRVSFIKNNKAINISFPLFPADIFPDVNKLLSTFGYNNGICKNTGKCYENEAEYLINIASQSAVLKDETIKSVIDVYRQILSTFKFTE